MRLVILAFAALLALPTLARAQGDRALAALRPEHDRQLLRGVPVGLEARLVAGLTFIKLPDGAFHRRAAGVKLIDGLLGNPALATAPAEFRAAVNRASETLEKTSR